MVGKGYRGSPIDKPPSVPVPNGMARVTVYFKSGESLVLPLVDLEDALGATDPRLYGENSGFTLSHNGARVFVAFDSVAAVSAESSAFVEGGS